MIGQFLNTNLRILKYSLQHISRNLAQSLLVTTMLTVAFLFAQMFSLVLFASNQTLIYLENQPQVLVFFKDEARPEQLMQIKTELEKDPAIEEVTYISKEQAVEIFRDLHQDEPVLLEFVTADILPASLEISGNNVKYLMEIATQFQNNHFVERVSFKRDLVNEILSLTQAIRTAGLAIVGALAVIAILIMLIVINNNIRTFGEEIEIMRLVGAGRAYITWPFLLDSTIFTIFSTTIATVITNWTLPSLHEFVHTFIAPIGRLQPPTEFTIVQTSPTGWWLLDPISINFWVWTTLIGIGLNVFFTLLTTWRKLGR